MGAGADAHAAGSLAMMSSPRDAHGSSHGHQGWHLLTHRKRRCWNLHPLWLTLPLAIAGFLFRGTAPILAAVPSQLRGTVSLNERSQGAADAAASDASHEALKDLALADAGREVAWSAPPQWPGNGFLVPELSKVVRGKRIFIVSHDMSPTGAPRVATELANILQNAGALVTVAVPQEGVSFMGSVPLIDQVRFFVPGDVPFKVVVGADFAAAAAADLVMVNTAHPRMTAWIQGFRSSPDPRARNHGGLLWYIHEGEGVMSEFERRHTDAAIDIISSDMLDGVMFVSWSAQQWWINQARDRGLYRFPTILRVNGWGLPSWRTARLGAAKSDLAAQAAYRAELGIAKKDVVFLVLASLNARKGHAGILSAFLRAQKLCEDASAGAPKWHLVMAGHGVNTLRLPGWDSSSVHLLNPIDKPERLTAMSDVYVSNSQNGGESWGLSPLEALATDRALLTVGLGGALEQVQDGVHALLHRGTEDGGRQLAGNMCALAQNRAFATRIAHAGYAMVLEQFGQARIEQKVSVHLAALLGRAQRARPRSSPPALGAWRQPGGARLDPEWDCGLVAAGSTVTLGSSSAAAGGTGGGVHRGSVCVLGGDGGRVVRPRLPAPLPADAGVGVNVGAGLLVTIGGSVLVGSHLADAEYIALSAGAAMLLPPFSEQGGALLAAVPLPPLPRHRRRPLVVIRAGGMGAPAPGGAESVPGGGAYTVHVLAGTAEDGAEPVGSHYAITLTLGGAGAARGVTVAEPRWTELPPLPIPAVDAASVAVGEFLYVFGGQRGCDRPHCSSALGLVQHPFFGEVLNGRPTMYGASFRFHLRNATWERLLDMPVPVSEAGAVYVPTRGSVLLLAGRADTQAWLPIVQEYVLATREWAVHEALVPRLVGQPVAWLSGNRLTVATPAAPASPLQYTGLGPAGNADAAPASV